jgi:hypothetical protein
MRRNARLGGITDESVIGSFVLARTLVWFVMTNSALNAYGVRSVPAENVCAAHNGVTCN